MPIVHCIDWAKAYIASHKDLPNLTKRQKEKLTEALKIVANQPLAPR